MLYYIGDTAADPAGLPPGLYILLLIISLECYLSSSGTPSLQVGFRQVVIEKRQLLVNRKPILIKGVNRHEHDERHGKAVTEQGMLDDIFLLKQLNFNSVRCSHYPNCHRW